MKKILFTLIVLFSFTSSSLAKQTYYSDYTEYTKYSEDFAEQNDLREVVTERRYKFYTQKKEDGGYYLYNENDKNYPEIELNNYILTDYSDWSKTKIEQTDHIIVDKRDVYEYQEMEKVRYINFDNIYGGNNALRFGEINVFVNGDKINYTPHSSGCSNGFRDYINNGITDENKAYIINGNNLSLDLNDYYNIDEIEVVVYLYDGTTEEKRFTINFSKDEQYTDYKMLEKNENLNFTNTTSNPVSTFNYNYQNMTLLEKYWQPKKVSYEPIESSFTRKVDYYLEYRYQEKKYNYYKNTKIYLDDYYNEFDGYEKDETLYKDYYKYRTRDRIIIDDVIITNNNQKIEDFIDSTKSYEVVGQIDYSKNGNQDLTIKTPFAELKVNAKIDIKENIISELEYEKQQYEENLKNTILKIQNSCDLEKQSLINQSNEYLNKIIELNNKLELSDNTLKQTIKDYEKIISNYQNKLIKEETAEKDQKEIKKSSVVTTPILIILLILLLILFLIRILKKEKQNL